MLKFIIAKNRFHYQEFKRFYFEEKIIGLTFLLGMTAMLGIGVGTLIPSIIAFFLSGALLLAGIAKWSDNLVVSTALMCIVTVVFNELPGILHEKIMARHPKKQR